MKRIRKKKNFTCKYIYIFLYINAIEKERNNIRIFYVDIFFSLLLTISRNFDRLFRSSHRRVKKFFPEIDVDVKSNG